MPYTGSALHDKAMRRGVRAGRRSTIGNRVYVNRVPRVRISPSPPDFKGLLDNSSPFFFALISIMCDFLCDRLKKSHSFGVNAKLVEVQFGSLQVFMPKDFLCPVGVVQ